jgi:hypothetical protein
VESSGKATSHVPQARGTWGPGAVKDPVRVRKYLERKPGDPVADL